jgi:hypothetical protein
LEKSLSEQYQQRLKLHTEDVDSWRAAEFSRLDSPTEEANFDLDRFMAKYFLDSLHGQPAPDKNKEPLVLEYVHKFNFEMAVQAIPGLAAHITDRLTVVGWKTNLQRGLDAAFAKLSSPDAGLHIPTSEANFDLDRFLAKYFFGLNGKPAPRKTPEPITLYTFFKHGAQLQAAVASIPGLHLCRADGIYGAKTIIGWDVDKVKLRKHEIEEEKAKKEAEEAAAALAAKEDTWQHALQPHREYMKNRQVPAGPLKLAQLTGSYVVRCEKIEDYCGDGEVMTLDIAQPCNAHEATAAFDFRLVEGTMLLASSDDALHLLRQGLEVGSDEEVDPDSDNSDFDGYAGPRKRKTKGTHTAQGPIKRRLGESPVPNRVYVQWAGRDPGTGETQLDTNNEHTGHLDFDASKAFAQGVFSYPSFFGNARLAFAIYKVADRPSKVPDSWSHFSEKQYNYESRARWGRW